MSAGQFKPIRASIIPPTPPPTGGHVKLVRPPNVPADLPDDDAPIGGPYPVAGGTGGHRKPTTGTFRKPTTLPATGAHPAPTAKAPGSAGHPKPGSAGHRKPTVLPSTDAPGAPGSAGLRKPTVLPSGTHTKPTETTTGHWKSNSVPPTRSYPRPAVPLDAPVEAKPATGSHAKPATGSHAKPATGSHAKPATGSHAKPATGSHSKPGTGSHSKPATGSHARPKQFRATPSAANDVSMGKFVAAVLGLVAVLASAGVAGKKLEPVEVVEEPPAWSYDRDAALLAQAAPVVVEPVAAPVAPAQRERDAIRLDVVVKPGEIAIGGDDVTTEEVEEPLTISPDRFDTVIETVHQDDAGQSYWVDLVDGRRIELDAATAKALLDARPLRMTYERDGAPEVVQDE